MMTKVNAVKVLGIVTTVAGMAATLISDWVDEQKMNEKIDEKVTEKVAEALAKIQMNK